MVPQRKARHCSNSSNFKARIATWNIYNAKDEFQLAEFAKVAKKLDLSILAVQETRRDGEKLEDFYFPGSELKDWRFIGSGFSGHGGIGFILSPEVDLVEAHRHEKPAWGRILSIRVKLRGVRLKVTTVYAPHNGYSDLEKTAFYRTLEQVATTMDKYPKFKAVQLGDFNAVVGSDASLQWGPVCGPNNPNVRDTNDNGF